MVEKRSFVFLALMGLIIALFMPLAAAADGCPPENPNCNIEPPQSMEVNPNPLHADGSPVELAEPGALSPQLIPMPLPRNVDPLPLPSQETAEILPVPMRYQDPEDATCGVQALGMAMSGLGQDAPSSAAIQAFLEDNGMMYDFGTGVEELAYAAQSLGYKGSLPFHGWTLEELQAELSAGRPVVVSLGANGEGNPGHFVTVTGISAGQVAFNDPTLGKQVISTEEFLRLWSLEGNSGVAVRREAPAGDSAGLAPWVAAGAALMALISQTPLALLRKGIGGRLDPGGAGAGRGPAPPGYRWVQRQTPKYEWQEVQEGWDMVPETVPNMVRRYTQVGWTTTTERIPRYETVRVQDGWTYTYERVPTYRTERYIQSWRTEYTRQATFRYVGGRRIFAGYRSVARRVPVYGTRQVFTGWRTETRRVPRMVERTVLAGWDFVEKRVPKYGWVEVQDGWTTETVRIPRMVRRQVQVGTETRWVLERVPTPVPPRRPPTPPETLTPTPTPPGHEPEATETPMPPRVPTSEPEFAVLQDPYPPGFAPSHDQMWDLLPNVRGAWIARGLRGIRAFSNASTAGVLQFNALESGLISISAPSIPNGQRIPFRQGYGFDGTSYSSANVTRISSGRLVRGAFSKSTLLTALGTSIFGNLYDYTVGSHRDEGLKSRGFWVSTGIDYALAVGTGLAAAGFVAGVTLLAGATFPVWATIAGAAIVGTGIGFVLEALGVGEGLKQRVNDGLDAWVGIAHNAGIIAQVAVERTSEAIRNTAQTVATATRNVVSSISDTVQEASQAVAETIQNVGSTISNAVETITEGVSGFLGRIFGGG